MGVSEIRPEVLQFAAAMEEELRQHDGRGTWPQSIPYLGWFYDRLMQERDELVQARDRLWEVPPDERDGECRTKIRQEAADVANFAMFIAFWDGDLEVADAS